MPTCIGIAENKVEISNTYPVHSTININYRMFKAALIRNFIVTLDLLTVSNVRGDASPTENY